MKKAKIKTNDTNRLIAFVLITYALSWTINFTLSLELQDFIMFVPGIVAIVMMLIKKENLTNLIKLGSGRNLTIGIILPIIAFAIVIILCKLFSLAEFGLAKDLLPDANGDKIEIAKHVFFLVLPLLIVLNCVFALGEEIGWRGFLLEKLRLSGKHSFISRALIVGVIWGIWHVPLYYILGAEVQNIGVLLVNVCLISIVFAWLYERENSIWPSVLAHASHNIFFNFILELLTISRSGPDILYAEDGLLVTASYMVIIGVGYLAKKRI
jgi:membrane protease YdiL (CAAX protease family)